MTGTYFETFLVGGLGLLVAAALAIAWLLWRQEDIRRDAIKLSLEGIGAEFRLNMFQTVRELADVESGRLGLAGDLPVLDHPQLDGVLAETMAADKRALAALQATYQSIEASKRRLRYALDRGEPIETPLEDAKAAAIDGICTLYLWEKQDGRPPEKAHATRSWWVRDWMKAHGFHQDLLPGLALRDAVVENLRCAGMRLTPHPLTLTAHEYYSRPYDRKADPRGVFGKRRHAGGEEEDAEKAAIVEEETAVEPVTPETPLETIAEEKADAGPDEEQVPASVETPGSNSPEPAQTAPSNETEPVTAAQDTSAEAVAAEDQASSPYIPFGKSASTGQASAPTGEGSPEDATERGSGS